MSKPHLSLEERLRGHPQLKKHVLGLLEIAEGDIASADEVDERRIALFRGLGKQVLRECAHQQAHRQARALKADARVRGHGKNSIGSARSVRLRSRSGRFLRAGRLVRPFGARAGVKCRGSSAPLQRCMTDLGAKKSFAKAARQFKEHYGVQVPVGAIRVITQEHGRRMLRRVSARDGAIKQLIAETDGSMIPKVDIDEKAAWDRRKTRQVGWKEAHFSLVYARGSVQPMFTITTGSPEQAGAQLAACAKWA